MTSDEILMLSVKNGTLDSLAPLFERYHVRLFNFFLRLTSNRETSEDLTQNVFQRILRFRHTYKDGHPFRSWMYRMARNLHADHYRKNKGSMDAFEDADYSRQTERLAVVEMEKLERKRNLMEALNLLPVEQKELILLSRFEGFNYEEISRIKGLSVAAIKVRVHRAIGRLREIYFETSGEGGKKQ